MLKTVESFNKLKALNKSRIDEVRYERNFRKSSFKNEHISFCQFLLTRGPYLSSLCTTSFVSSSFSIRSLTSYKYPLN
jgi:hypothetical protein